MRLGVDTVFGIPGGQNLAIYDALRAGQHRIRHVMGRHEQGLGFMADGYARASGRIGVVIATSGPAVANLACAMGQASTDTSPVLAIASAVSSELIGKHRGDLHDCGDASEIMRPVCRHVRRCNRIEEVPRVLRELVHELRAGRPGGAFCEVPCDVLDAVGEVEILPASGRVTSRAAKRLGRGGGRTFGRSPATVALGGHRRDRQRGGKRNRRPGPAAWRHYRSLRHSVEALSRPTTDKWFPSTVLYSRRLMRSLPMPTWC